MVVLALLIVTIWSLNVLVTPAFFFSAHDDAIRINMIIQVNDLIGNEINILLTTYQDIADQGLHPVGDHIFYNPFFFYPDIKICFTFRQINCSLIFTLIQ